MARLDGETALVTGASRGIGRGIAERFAAEGATVAVNHPPGEAGNAEAVVDGIEADGGAALAVEADVGDPEAVASMVETVERRAGPLDVLVNNAGGGADPAPVEELSVESWDRVVDVNLRASFLTSKHAVPGMVDSGGGSIVNVASQLAFLGEAEKTHYCAAKGGLISFTRSLARELAPAVRVNAIAPGPIVTGKRDHLGPEWRRERAETVPMDRVGEVEDVVPTALFLASEDSAYYTGQTLHPDGGEAMR